MARFKVGDEVRVKKGLVEGKNSRGENYINTEMCTDYLDRTYTIARVIPSGGYKIALDGEGQSWNWYNRCFEQYLDWDEFGKGGIAVNTPTDASLKRFLKAAHKRGFKWNNGDDLLEGGISSTRVYKEKHHLAAHGCEQGGKRGLMYGDDKCYEDVPVVEWR